MSARGIVFASAALAALAFPIAAQASPRAVEVVPQRAAGPAEQGNEMRSSWVIGFFALAAIIAAILIAASNDNDPVSP